MVEKARTEEHGLVLAIGYEQAVSGILFQKYYNPRLIGIIILDLPIGGGRRAADDQASTVRAEVGLRRRDPEIDADSGVVGVDVDRRLRPQPLEGPGLGQRMRAENAGKRAPQLVRDLQQQRTREPILEIGGDEALDMGEIVPDRALQQEPPQRIQRRRRE